MSIPKGRRVKIKSGPHAGLFGRFVNVWPPDDPNNPRDHAVILEKDEKAKRFTFFRGDELEVQPILSWKVAIAMTAVLIPLVLGLILAPRRSSANE